MSAAAGSGDDFTLPYGIVAIAASAGGISAGRSIRCTVTCSPLRGAGDGAVLLMEETYQD